MECIAQGQNFARYRLGSLVVTALRDGYVDMPQSRLRQIGNLPFGADFPDQIPLHDGKLRLSVNAFLVEGDQQVTLIDTGASDAWLPSMGRLPQAMQEAGIDPARITTVALTHTHEDHLNGLILPGGADAFPNMKDLWVPEAELPLFRKEMRLQRFHNRANALRPGQMPGERIEAIAAYGHEIGHTCFRVSDGAAELLVLGDTIHVPSIQFARPDLTWELDTDQDAARSSRLHLLERATATGCWVAGAHLDWPGVGKVKRNGEAYELVTI